MTLLLTPPVSCEPGAAPVDLVPGTTIAGKYTLIRPIGVGGMGAVWLACNEATGGEVALKVLLPHPDEVADLRARFRREAYTTARLCHRGIVRVYDLVEVRCDDDTSLVLVMELLRGQTLAAFLRERGKLPLEDVLAIMLPVLSALAYAHDAGIVHRDLKPENIFLAVDPDGLVTPKLLDFGISKVSLPKAPVITREGEMIGTPTYMSPEQVRGKSSVDAHSDIFNVGILLYEMLSGRNPFAADGLHSVVVAILEETPAPIPFVPREVWKVIERALRKVPRDRYGSVADLAVELRLAVGLPTGQGGLVAERSSGARRAYTISSSSSWVSPSLHLQARTRFRRLAPIAVVAAAAAIAVAVASVASMSIAWGSRTVASGSEPAAPAAVEVPVLAPARLAIPRPGATPSKQAAQEPAF